MLNNYLDDLALENSFLSGGTEKETVELFVLGLREFTQFRSIMDAIAELDQVTAVQLRSANDLGMRFSVKYQSDLQSLENSIVAATNLESQEGVSLRDGELVYWQPALSPRLRDQIINALRDQGLLEAPNAGLPAAPERANEIELLDNDSKR